MRMLAQMMAAEGYDVCSWELTGAPKPLALCDALKADIIVLPLPAEKNGYLRRHRAHDGEPAALAAARAPHFRGQCGKRRVNARAVVGAYDHGLLCLGRTERAQRDPDGGGGHRGGDEAHERHTARHAVPRAWLWPHRKGARARSERAGERRSASARASGRTLRGSTRSATRRCTRTASPARWGNSAWCSTPCRIRYWTKRSLPSCRRTACSSSLRARAALTWTRSKRCAFRISRQGDCPGASRRRRRRAPSKKTLCRLIKEEA